MIVKKKEELRKIPPGTHRYNPVTYEQSTLRRPLLRSPFQDRIRASRKKNLR